MGLTADIQSEDALSAFCDGLSVERYFNSCGLRGSAQHKPNAINADGEDESFHPVLVNHKQRERHHGDHERDGNDLDALANPAVFVPIAKRLAEPLVIQQPPLESLVASFEAEEGEDQENGRRGAGDEIIGEAYRRERDTRRRVGDADGTMW